MSTRPRLDHDQVLATAEAIVDRDGWQALTMTALAKELGVKVPSLYNHVPNLEALRGELQCSTLREIGERLNRKAMGRTGETAMRAMAETYRDYARTHPGRYDLATQAPVDDAAIAEAATAAGAALHAVIRSYGIEEEALELQLSTFAALPGVLVLETAGFFPDFVDTDPIFETVLGLVLDLLERRAPGEARAS
jgi:AcrR family transcriptional regulator